jgi:hypothetical protein
MIKLGGNLTSIKIRFDATSIGGDINRRLRSGLNINERIHWQSTLKLMSSGNFHHRSIGFNKFKLLKG